jgi:hypothetical protein
LKFPPFPRRREARDRRSSRTRQPFRHETHPSHHHLLPGYSR